MTLEQRESLKGDPGKHGKDLTWDQLTDAQKEDLRPEVNEELIIAGVLDHLDQNAPGEPISASQLPRLVEDVLMKLNARDEVTALRVIYSDGNKSEWRKLVSGTIQQITNTVAPSGGKAKGGVPTKEDKNKAVSSTITGDQQDTGLTITKTPLGVSYVWILINGISYTVSDGSTISDPFYFSNDGGITAKVIGSIIAGDSLFFNQSVVGFKLRPNDRIDFDYDTS